MKIQMSSKLWALVACSALLAAPSFSQQPAAPADIRADVEVDHADLPRSAGSVTSFAPVIEKVAPSVVTVFAAKRLNVRGGALDPTIRRFFNIPDPGNRRRGRQPRVEGLGSGVIVSKEGHILTNNHVVQGADEIMVSLGREKKEYTAKKIGTDPASDLALLKIEPSDALHPITFADSDKVRAGDVALAVGNPFGLKQSASMGIVSAVGRGGMGITDYENFIQTDAAINMGNSGGALVDVDGRLIGINTAIFSRTGTNSGIGFAIPANLARNVMQNLLEKGRVVRGYIGVIIQPLSSELAGAFKLDSEDGALIAEVTPNTPASDAGLRTGDVVTGIDGKPISGPQELQLAVGGTDPGTKVELTIYRDGKKQTVPVTLGELPAREGQIAQAEPEGKSNVLDGIAVGDIDPAASRQFDIPADTKGVVITSIETDSAGYAAGLREGDVLQEMNRRELTDMDQAIDLSNQIEKNDPVLLRVLSKGASRYVVLNPDQEPTADPDPE